MSKGAKVKRVKEGKNVPGNRPLRSRSPEVDPGLGFGPIRLPPSTG